MQVENRYEMSVAIPPRTSATAATAVHGFQPLKLDEWSLHQAGPKSLAEQTASERSKGRQT